MRPSLGIVAAAERYRSFVRVSITYSSFGIFGTLLLNRNKHIGEECFVFYKFEFQLNTFTDPCPTAATCVSCNSTCKLIISTDMIIEIQITKLLAKLLTESHWP